MNSAFSLRLAALALLTLLPAATAYDLDSPTPVLPIGGEELDSGTYFAPVYSVYDKAGKNYTGVVVGDGDFSVTYPSEGKGTVLRYGNILINLDRK
jgi:hypothetical protein